MDLTEFHNKLKPYIVNKEVQSMARYMAHGKTNTLEHCYLVARLSYKVCKQLNLHVDIDAVIAGAILHDFYLYDWHIEDPKHKWHGRLHGETALKNASKHFILNKKMQNVIESHMWPKCKTKPLYLESAVVSICDKCSALKELIWRHEPTLPFLEKYIIA